MGFTALVKNIRLFAKVFFETVYKRFLHMEILAPESPEVGCKKTGDIADTGDVGAESGGPK